MVFNDIPVTRLSQQDIEAAALAWSNLGAHEDRGVVDIIRLYELAKVALLVRSDAEMGEDEARAAPSLNRVFVRASLLRRVERGDLDAKMILAHEAGHVALHRGPEMKARKVDGNAEMRFIHEDESAEKQGWKFARALAMPLAIVAEFRSADALAIRCDVPLEHARLRLAETAQLLAKRTPLPLVEHLLQQRKSPAELRTIQKAKEARERLRIWNTAQRIPGDRTNSRMCSRGKWRVVWSEYNQMTECGWLLKDGKIVAWLDMRTG